MGNREVITTQGQGPEVFSPGSVRREISGTNNRIANLLNGRRPYMLSDEEEVPLENLYRRKSLLIIEALKLKQQGAKTIEVDLVGSSVADLRPHSFNAIVVSFVISENPPKTYKTRVPFALLQNAYDGDLRELLGTPDRFVQESDEEVVVREIQEINWVSNDLSIASKTGDRKKVSRLGQLKAELVESVFEKRALGNLGGGRLEVLYIRRLYEEDIVGVDFYLPGEETGRESFAGGFHLLPSRTRNHRFPNRLQ